MKINTYKPIHLAFSGVLLLTGNLVVAQSDVPVSNSITTVTTNTAVTTDTAITTVTPVTTVTTVTPNTPTTSVTSVTTNTPVTTVTTNTSKTTDSSLATAEGTVDQSAQDTVAIKSTPSGVPVNYSYTKTTTYFDENGNPVSREVVTSGRPVVVYYTQDGGTRVVHKIIVSIHHGKKKLEHWFHHLFN